MTALKVPGRGGRLLTFAHGDGPGSRWARDLSEGDSCQFFRSAPRSLDLSGLESPVVLFGDETSFGLAAALRNSPQGADAVHVFEASDIAVGAAGAGSESASATRRADLQALPPMTSIPSWAEADRLLLAASGVHFVLTGKAASIQRVSRALKAAGVVKSRLKTAAYWAQGKIGLTPILS